MLSWCRSFFTRSSCSHAGVRRVARSRTRLGVGISPNRPLLRLRQLLKPACAGRTYLKCARRQRYGVCPLLSSSSLPCDWPLTHSDVHRSIGSLPRANADWLIGVELDNARISRRISATGSGGSGDVLINVTDAADSKLCLRLSSFPKTMNSRQPP